MQAEQVFEIVALYADGGVIASNPSAIGGTYAYRLIGMKEVFRRGNSGVLSASKMGAPVTNNQTEMLALLLGMEQLPCDFKGTVYSDSAVTLGRVFDGWKWKNIPAWMHTIYQKQRARFIHWDEIKHVLLSGHPTKKQLAAGIGKHGYPVSEHNVWCDEACRLAGEAFMEEMGRK